MDHAGLRLREERLRLRMTQVELAAIGGVQKQAQLLYEKGERNPDAAYLSAVAAKGVDVLYVITACRSSTLLSADEELVLAGYRTLDTKSKAGVLGLIGGMTQPPQPKSTMVFHGQVGQQVHGDVTYQDAVTVKVGGGPKTKKEK